jgi:hypothetical protein
MPQVGSVSPGGGRQPEEVDTEGFRAFHFERFDLVVTFEETMVAIVRVIELRRERRKRVGPHRRCTVVSGDGKGERTDGNTSDGITACVQIIETGQRRFEIRKCKNHPYWWSA